ncbi:MULTISPECIES: flagellar hook-length control protein FliK [unclassified Shewanella]|uniref:flagellar hook-length control protein FliK n=1 Tax=unclassified Shewanella TaxID=196818 RepID=UPI001BBB9AFC|nr:MULTISPECIES: flagellar hook-length control protein FliK [unclassified Shewanella]GIU14689.1 flagellar hook-length control protein FliK [Shewanella sp. MBTL60-112-B1]GIU37776.1 flagellar hook-length control protein FliK [Shewanella sp. MBTL60-112-B2]
MINNSVLPGSAPQTGSCQLSTQIKSHSCHQSQDPLEQHQADALPFSFAFASTGTSEANQQSLLATGTLPTSLQKTSTEASSAAIKTVSTLATSDTGLLYAQALQAQSVASKTQSHETSAQTLHQPLMSSVTLNALDGHANSHSTNAQTLNASASPQGAGQAQTSSLSASNYQQQSSLINSAAPQTSLPQQAGTLKSDSLMSRNLFQAMNTPQQTSITDTAAVDIVDSVNQILASSTRSQATVAQWGPVAVSQAAPLLQQAHEMLSPLREQLKFQIDQQIKQAEIRLDPPELGKVELNVRLDGDRLHIQMHAANSSVRDALLMGLDRLRAELAMDHGGQIDVDISQDDRQQKQDSPASEFAIASATAIEPERTFNSRNQPQDHVDLLA